MAVLTYIPATGADDTSDSVTLPTYTIEDGGVIRMGVGGAGTSYRAGIRFPGIQVNQGATITSATLTLRRAALTGGPSGNWNGFAVDNVVPWSQQPVRPGANTNYTTANTAWITNSDPAVHTVTAIIQEIVNRAGWQYGNALAFLPTTTGSVNTNISWYARDVSSTVCPVLTITVADTTGVKKISELPAATLPLSGNETIPIHRTGDTVSSRTTVAKISDTYNLGVGYTTAAPTAPTSGTTLYAMARAKASRLAWVGPNNLPVSVQPFMGAAKVAVWSATGNSIAAYNTTTPSHSPIGWRWATTGTPTAINVTSTSGAGSLFLGTRRMGFATAATANAVAALTGGSTQYNASNAGYEYICRFGVSATPVNSKTFVGLTTNVGGPAGNQTNLAATSAQLGMGKDYTDTNMRIYYNSTAGTCQFIDLGANFPGNTANIDLYEFRMLTVPGNADVYWCVERLNTGHYAEGVITSNRPGLTDYLMVWSGIATSTTTSCRLDIVSQYMETLN